MTHKVNDECISAIKKDNIIVFSFILKKSGYGLDLLKYVLEC